MSAKQPDQLRLATFNILHGAPEADRKDKQSRGSVEAVAEACKSLEADVLALQEVDRCQSRTGWAAMAYFIAEKCGMEVVFAPARRQNEGHSGNALLARGKIVNPKTVSLPRNDFFPVVSTRNAIFANLVVGEQKLSVVNAHLSPERAINRKQLSKVSSILARMPEPQVLMGDLNQTVEQICELPSVASMEIVESEPTYPLLEKQIDHIALRGLAVVSTEVISFPFSDHNALVADVI